MRSGKLGSLHVGAIVVVTLGLSGSVFADPPPLNKAPGEAAVKPVQANAGAAKAEVAKSSAVKPVQANAGTAKADTAKNSAVKPTQTNEGAVKGVEARTKREKPEDETAEGEQAKGAEGAARGKLFRKMSKDEKKAYQARLKELNVQRKETRKERSEKEREKLKLTLGPAEPSAAVQAELKVHAWRIARLSRLLEMAQARELAEPIARIEELQKKEDERHVKQLALAKAQGPDSPKAGALKPDSAKPAAAKPDAAKPAPLKPDALKPEAAQNKESK